VNARRLYRCRHDRWLAGVAGGMAEYFEVDPTVVRVLWILSAFLGGVTILLYILLAFVMPPEPLPMMGTSYPGAPGATGAGAGAGGVAGTPSPGASAATGGIPGWTPPQGGTPEPGWNAHAGAPSSTWVGHRHEAGTSRGNGRTGFTLGVLLVVFGSIALLGSVIPAWTAVGLGPAFILALGVALVVAAMRRPAGRPDRGPAMGSGHRIRAVAADTGCVARNRFDRPRLRP
jgi:phage shock protein C